MLKYCGIYENHIKQFNDIKNYGTHIKNTVREAQPMKSAQANWSDGPNWSQKNIGHCITEINWIWDENPNSDQLAPLLNQKAGTHSFPRHTNLSKPNSSNYINSTKYGWSLLLFLYWHMVNTQQNASFLSAKFETLAKKRTKRTLLNSARTSINKADFCSKGRTAPTPNNYCYVINVTTPLFTHFV